MPRVLNIFDVSPFIHAGHVNKYSFLESLIDVGVTAKTLRTPTGGTSLLFNAIYDVAGDGDMVFCCDRNPTIKKDMCPGYKSNRTYTPELEVEKQAAEYILKQCNATVLAYAGYEADDIIYTLVRKLHSCYDKIWIYTGDSDLYFLVDDVVGVKPSSSRAKLVTLQNYKTITLKGETYPYNSITLSKILQGDTSDCIPGLPLARRREIAANLYKPALLPKMGDKEAVKYAFSLFAPEFLSQVDLVFPLEVDDVPTTFNALDTEAVRNWGAAIRNKYFRGHASRGFDVTPYVEEMQSMGIYLEE